MNNLSESCWCPKHLEFVCGFRGTLIYQICGAKGYFGLGEIIQYGLDGESTTFGVCMVFVVS